VPGVGARGPVVRLNSRPPQPVLDADRPAWGCSSTSSHTSSSGDEGSRSSRTSPLHSCGPFEHGGSEEELWGAADSSAGVASVGVRDLGADGFTVSCARLGSSVSISSSCDISTSSSRAITSGDPPTWLLIDCSHGE